jgi:NADH-quinone oxidoreductase subunit J
MNITIGDVVIPIPPIGQQVFMAAAGLSILGGVMMITRKNAVHAALWLVLTFFQLALMYVLLGAEFLAALQVLVYTGAIVVLFLFVIMLLGLREGPQIGGIHTAQLWAAWPVGIILMLEIITVVLFSAQPGQAQVGDIIGGETVVWSNQQVAATGGNVQALGQTLYTQFLLPFEIASLILLLAVIGAIVLARKEEPSEVEDMIPSVGISLARRTTSNSPQEEQLEKKLFPALGRRRTVRVPGEETPTVEQPSGYGTGTTSGVEVETSGAGTGGKE